MTGPQGDAVIVQVTGTIDGLVDAMGNAVESVNQATARMQSSLGTLADSAEASAETTASAFDGMGRRFQSTGVMVAFALEGMANGSESMSRRALRSIALLGLAFGSEGYLVAGIAIATQAVLDFFHHAEEEADRLQKKLGDMANTGDLAGLNREMQKLKTGLPFDDKGNFVGAPVNGAFAGSIKFLQDQLDVLIAKQKRYNDEANSTFGGAPKAAAADATATQTSPQDLQARIDTTTTALDALKVKAEQVQQALDFLQNPDAAKGSTSAGPRSSVMQQFELEWEERKKEAIANGDDLTQEEQSFWFRKLAVVHQGTQEYLEVLRRFNDANLAADRETEETDRQATTSQVDNAAKVLRTREGFAELLKRLDNANDERVKKTRELWAQMLASAADSTKQATEQLEHDWVHAFETIEASIERTFERAREYGSTTGQLLQSIAHDIEQAFVRSEVRIAEAHLARWLATKRQDGETNAEAIKGAALHVAAWTAAFAETLAVKVAVTAEGLALEVAAATKSIAVAAARAAAWTWAEIASIPVVGPFLAPVAAAAALAGVLELGHLASAAGGYDIPSGINPVTQLHAQEMVLPAHLANAVREMAAGSGGGSGGGDVHVHVHAMDAQSVARWARNPQNAQAVGAAALHAVGKLGVVPRNSAGRRG